MKAFNTDTVEICYDHDRDDILVILEMPNIPRIGEYVQVDWGSETISGEVIDIARLYHFEFPKETDEMYRLYVTRLILDNGTTARDETETG